MILRRLPFARRAAVPCATAVAVLALVPTAVANPLHFPVPHCGWASSALVGSRIGEPVRMLKPRWSEHLAPTLSCGYVERTPKLQFGATPIVEIAFAEDQRFHTTGMTAVSGLGSCIEQSSCPRPHQPAWERVVPSRMPQSTTPGSSQSATTASAQQTTFTSVVQLRVEDGLNAIFVTIDNPDGPLSVRSETGAAESIVRGLLRRFHWT